MKPGSLRVRGRVAALALLLLGACGDGGDYPSEMPPDFEVAIERDPCFGTCPVYALRISADGGLAFEGRRFVLVEGTVDAVLSPERLREVYRAVVDADFFGLEDRYAVGATDLPGMSLGITLGGRTKTVYHYGLACGSDMEVAPEALCRLESVLGSIPVSMGWTRF